MKSNWSKLDMAIKRSNRKKRVTVKNGPIYQWHEQHNVERIERSLDKEFAKKRIKK